MDEKIKILVADDDQSTTMLVETILKGAGFDTVVANDGFEAIHKVYETRPDFILLDIFMPKMSGYQVCRLLKNDDTTASIPIMMLTGVNDKNAKFWSLHTGANHFIRKDFNTSGRFISLVRRALKQHDITHHSNGKHGTKPISDPFEILSRVSGILDLELQWATIEKMKLQLTVEQLSEGVFTIEENQKITLFNPAMERMTNLLAKDALGKKCCDVFQKSLCKKTCLSEQAMESNQDIEDKELMLISKKGVCLSVLTNVSVLKNTQGEAVGAVFNLKDMTKHKEVERMKSDFTAMVTHELRTPLSVIQEGAAQLIDGIHGDITPTQKEYIGKIKRVARQINSLVDELLDLAKLARGSEVLNHSYVSIGDLAKRCTALMQSIADKKKVTLVCKVDKEPQLMSVDATRIEQVFLNLLSNAIKFTPARGEVTVRISSLAEGIECSVQDSGSGISEDSLESIFDAYQQMRQARVRKPTGTGLGLAVVKNIVEAHEGKIWCESKIGKGSKFIFVLP